MKSILHRLPSPFSMDRQSILTLIIKPRMIVYGVVFRLVNIDQAASWPIIDEGQTTRQNNQSDVPVEEV